MALVGSKRLNKHLIKLLKDDQDVQKLYLCCMNYKDVGSLVDEKTVIVDEDKVFKLKPNVVVEDIGAKRALDIIRKSLESCAHVVVVSAAVFSEKKVVEEVEALSGECKRYAVVPFGALPAMDALEALSLDSLKDVSIWIRRSPEQLSNILREAGLEPEGLNLPVTVYEGSALEELIKVKEDINTLMAAVLAGRLDPTTKIIADNMVSGSEYKIKMTSEVAEIEVKAKYKVLDKISEIMIYSVYRAVKRLLKGWGVVVL